MCAHIYCQSSGETDESPRRDFSTVEQVLDGGRKEKGRIWLRRAVPTGVRWKSIPSSATTTGPVISRNVALVTIRGELSLYCVWFVLSFFLLLARLATLRARVFFDC